MESLEEFYPKFEQLTDQELTSAAIAGGLGLSASLVTTAATLAVVEVGNEVQERAAAFSSGSSALKPSNPQALERPIEAPAAEIMLGGILAATVAFAAAGALISNRVRAFQYRRNRRAFERTHEEIRALDEAV